jgi:activating signal cointegrator complex subunit 2
VDVSRLHFGRKEQGTADSMLTTRDAASSKAAILSALAAFDSDDDERDDTYDVEDVGGMVDAGAPGSEETDADLRSGNEEVLFKMYRKNATAFERDSSTRRSHDRTVLREQTGMTDEAIEGWAVMIRRDPRRLRKLETKYSVFTGEQQELAPSAYGRNADGASGESDNPDGQGRQGPSRARGRGGRSRGRANKGSRPAEGGSGKENSSRGRANKEAHKSSRANHNRRDQRARKMARGGFAG